MVQTPWSESEATTTRLTRGAEKLGCRASTTDSTGDIEIVCREGKPDPDSDEGKLYIGPDTEKKLLAMCNDGLAEHCSETLERIWKAGAE